MSEPSIDGVAKALNRFETYTGFKDFRAFHRKQAIAFKSHLTSERNKRTGGTLSKATLHATMMALKQFIHWLAGQPGFRSRLSFDDAEYFNLSEKETRVAMARRHPRSPTIEQILHVLLSMPVATEIERRDRALIAFTLLTGARDGAIATFRLKHVDLAASLLEQDAREVATKFSKSFTTWFFPVPPAARTIVADWIDYLQTQKLWGPMTRSSRKPRSQLLTDSAFRPSVLIARLG